MAVNTRVAATASRWARLRLAGPVQEVRIVHAGRHALYVAVPVGNVERCVGVLSRHAVAVPCGLQTPLDELPHANAVARVGDGRVEIAGLGVEVGSAVDVSVPRFRAEDAQQMSGLLEWAAADRIRAAFTGLPAGALAGLRVGEGRAVPQLLGRGDGLTPLGDDVLTGWLATMRAAGQGSDDITKRIANASTDSTTLLSATLLDRAADGDVVPTFATFLTVLQRSSWSTVRNVRLVVEAVLGIGHSSGAGLLGGSLLALQNLGSRQR